MPGPYFAPRRFEIDWKNPDYTAIYDWRMEQLKFIRAHPHKLPQLKAYYAEHIAQFIIDWGVTFDPREAERDRPTTIPFILFEKQELWIDFFFRKWRERKPGMTEKSREVGVSWLAVAVSSSLCLLRKGIVAGFGSRKEEYVDARDNPKSLFWKARNFISRLPPEFTGSWDINKHAPHMRIVFPDTKSIMTGEAGDSIGRGDRTSFYIVDESAHLERPMLVDSALASTTNCRIDISSVNGMANPFAQKRHSGKVEVFTFHWRDDPRKDMDWYRKQVAELDPITVKQEFDIDYLASAEGVVIDAAWVHASVDAHKRLGIEIKGKRAGAMDVADEGRDANSFCVGHGILVENVWEWYGKGSDIYDSVVRAFKLCDENDLGEFTYDADGLGAGVRGDARVINEHRRLNGQRIILVNPHRGAESVLNPEAEDVKGVKNKNYFGNHKAQSWWAVRRRFQITYRAVVEGYKDYDPDEIISISSQCRNKDKVIVELSQATYKLNNQGQIVINKNPEGTRSPNNADGVVIRFGKPSRKAIRIDPAILADI